MYHTYPETTRTCDERVTMGPMPRRVKAACKGFPGTYRGIALPPEPRASGRTVDHRKNGKFGGKVERMARKEREEERGEELGRKGEKRAGGGREKGGLRKSG